MQYVRLLQVDTVEIYAVHIDVVRRKQPVLDLGPYLLARSHKTKSPQGLETHGLDTSPGRWSAIGGQVAMPWFVVVESIPITTSSKANTCRMDERHLKNLDA